MAGVLVMAAVIVMLRAVRRLNRLRWVGHLCMLVMFMRSMRCVIVRMCHRSGAAEVDDLGRSKGPAGIPDRAFVPTSD